MNKIKKPICLLLALLMVFTMLPMPILADEPIVIAEFAELEPQVLAQAVQLGTEETELVLPAVLTATEENGEPDALLVVGVTWECSTYDKDTVGDYLFTAQLPGYTLGGGAVQPVITVSVYEPISVTALDDLALVGQL